MHQNTHFETPELKKIELWGGTRPRPPMVSGHLPPHIPLAWI